MTEKRSNRETDALKLYRETFQTKKKKPDLNGSLVVKEEFKKEYLETLTSRNYDVALSFASEDREFVKAVYEELRKRGVSVFYDFDEEIAIDLWGRELIETLDEIYRKRSKCVVLFVSENYARKVWTNLERRSALARAIQEKSVYVLPAKFDETELPGLLATVVSIDLRTETPQTFAQKIIRKINKL